MLLSHCVAVRELMAPGRTDTNSGLKLFISRHREKSHRCHVGNSASFEC